MENHTPITMQENTMPLLRELCVEKKKKEDIIVLNINHDMRNAYVFSANLAKLFGKVVQIGASYSDSTAADREPFRDGIYYYAKSNRNGAFSLQRNEKPLRVVTPDFTSSIDMMITIAVKKDCLEDIEKGKKLLIIEDGGYHSSTIDNLYYIFPQIEGSIIGSVEQTTSGTKILSSRNVYNYPSISIARSEIKMCLESIFIGQRLVSELSAFLAHTNHFLNYSHVIVVGYGIFGRSVVHFLEPYQSRTVICDTDRRIRKAAEAEGYPSIEAFTPDVFHNDQIIMFMTGNKSFGEKELKAYMESDADRICFASGSSKDIEVKEILDMIQGLKESPYQFTLLNEGPYHKEYSVTDGQATKTFFIIANGMPVNFYRKNEISLTDKMVDLIYSEMTLCAVTVAEKKGLENQLYLLGDSKAPLQLDERKLMLRWFGMIGFEMEDSELDEHLLIHPEKDYLRKSSYKKIATNLLI